MIAVPQSILQSSQNLDAPWSIGVLTGKTLTSLAEPLPGINPILTATQVHDRNAAFVADPFALKVGNTWHLFFEIFDRDLGRGVIGHALSFDGFSWRYDRVVLQENVHLSYPYVFSHAGEIYMVPETRQAREVRLYRAQTFPHSWVAVTTLLRGKFADASLIKTPQYWWLFTSQGPYCLTAFFADDLMGPWKRHRRLFLSLHDKVRSRPGGRMVYDGEQLIRFAQDSTARYGHQLRAFVIDRLTPWRFQEQQLLQQPLLGPAGTGWNSAAMHHIDPHQQDDGSWIAFVDGAG